MTTKDFKLLIGSWQGSLTYLDYKSNKPYTMPANKEIIRVGETNKFIFYNIYPNEPNANSNDTVTISTDGKYIDNEEVMSVKMLENRNMEIITEESGTDGNDNKPAVIRHTYTFGKTIFTKRKDVQFVGESIWIKRNEFNYIRNTIPAD